MPTGSSRRYPRTSVSFPVDVVSFRSGDTVRDEGRLVVLGEAGAFLELRGDYSVGSMLRLGFELPPHAGRRHVYGDRPRPTRHGRGGRVSCCSAVPTNICFRNTPTRVTTVCPLWDQTAQLLERLIHRAPNHSSASPVFTSQSGRALTRFGIYKIVRRHTAQLHATQPSPAQHHISPHVFRHTAAVHLLEAGVDVNVIRSWLGHVRLDTTNRYAEITVRAKEAALRLCEPPSSASQMSRSTPNWRDDQTLLAWLASL